MRYIYRKYDPNKLGLKEKSNHTFNCLYQFNKYMIEKYGFNLLACNFSLDDKEYPKEWIFKVIYERSGELLGYLKVEE